MKALIQRVTSAKVTIHEKVCGQISKGYVILLGVKEGDSEKEVDILAEKIVNLRIMSDENDKMNLSIKDIDGEILVVSQFTLYADLSAGRRPSFVKAAKPELARVLYKYFIGKLVAAKLGKIACGEFGAYMKVEIINDGPVTIMLDTDQMQNSNKKL